MSSFSCSFSGGEYFNQPYTSPAPLEKPPPDDQAFPHTVHPSSTLGLLPRRRTEAAGSPARAPAPVGGSVVLSPGFPCICLAGTRTRLPMGERAGEGLPLAEASSPQSSGDPKLARAHASQSNPPRGLLLYIPRKSGRAREARTSPSTHRVPASLPQTAHTPNGIRGTREESVAPLPLPPRPAAGTPKADRLWCPGWAQQSSRPDPRS